ncbi:MAG: hypothetical protein AAGJ81_05810 [Verrucomicrobiota bacterium]
MTLSYVTRSSLQILFVGVLGLALGSVRLSAQLDLVFEDQSSAFDASDVWITFDNGGSATPFDVTYTPTGGSSTPITFGTYNSGGSTLTNHLSSSIRLSEVTGNRFTVNSVSSVAVFVSYGSGFSNLQASPSFFSGAPGADVTYQNFELTRTGGLGDQGNLTNINYFTAPMSIRSFSQGYMSGTTPVQSTGFSQSTVQIANRLAALSSSNSVSTGGTLRRYVGPSTYASNPPYPSFSNYLASVHASGVTNTIQNSNAFQTNGATSTTGTNYNFTFTLTSVVQSDNTIELTGEITTEVKDNATGVTTSGATYANADITISGTDQSAVDQIIYGQTAVPAALADDVTYGQGWTDWAAFVQNPANNLTDSFPEGVALDNLTLTRTAIGEITTAILMGFLGNVMVVDGSPLNTLPSEDWWKLDPLLAFDQIQSDPDNYNQWADVIYDASANGAYSIPFSDRLGTGPLVNSVQFNLNGTDYDIDEWVVGFGDPVSVIPEPGSAVLLVGLSVVGLALQRRR